MPHLNDYQQFDGRHWETGTVANFYGYQGVKAPHTGRPPSEALLMGISGGAVMGYFFFDYAGHDPHVRILTRNTFDPWTRMLSRLGVVQQVAHTTSAAKAVSNLTAALEEGIPALVWADHFSLPYNGLPEAADMWAMFPILVYGYDETADRVWIADRARVPLQVTTGDLHRARSRVKKDKFRVMTLEPPDWQKLAEAVTAGIHDCLQLYTEKPPKGTAKNFGFKAFDNWINLLTNPKDRKSWARMMPGGNRLVGGLISVYTDIRLFGKEGQADRDLYGQFLDEAAVILDKSGLAEAAGLFRRSGTAWDDLSLALLPAEIEPLGEIRRLIQQRHDLFLAEGGGALAAMREIDGRVAEIRGRLEDDFPLDEAGVAALREKVAAGVARIAALEREAVDLMQAAM